MSNPDSSARNQIDSSREREESMKLFFSIVAHDLRGSLAGIKSFSDLIARKADLSGNAQIVNYAELIYKSSGNTLALLDNMLEWSRLQTQGCLEFGSHSELNEVIEEEISSILTENREKFIQFQRIIPDEFDVPMPKCLLKSLIRNFLNNAFKFSFDGGEVLITARYENNYALISIKDKGIGMDNEMIEGLFDLRKLQVRSGTKGEKGTGIGLFICHEIVSKHKGSIRVTSSLGKGTEFVILIPLYS